MERQIQRLNEDLRFYKRELEREQDPFRRSLNQQRIAATQRAILALMKEERSCIDRENANMEFVLEVLRKREENKNKWVFSIEKFVLWQ